MGFLRTKTFVVILIFVLPLYVYAAGGGGGGSNSGLGFGSRDSIFILVSNTYSEKFTLKNGTKYDFKISVDEEKVNVNFGFLSFNLEENDNFIDLNDNNLTDINFKLEKHTKTRADVRVIDIKDLVEIAVEMPKSIVEESKTKIAEKEDKSQEQGLKCSNLPTLNERVFCRLDLEEDEQEKELELYYLPEECRDLEGSSRGLCIARYKSVQTCWKFPIGEERISCAKRAIKLGTIQDEKDICSEKPDQEKSECVNELKSKVYSLIKWYFYDLEERAEDFMQRGLINKDNATDFISKTEQNKIKFNEAKTKGERKNTILAVRNDWEEFVDNVKENLRG